MKSNKTILFVISVILALGVGFAAGFFAAVQGARPEVSMTPSPTATLLAFSSETAVSTRTRAAQSMPTSENLARPVSAEEMFSEFICPCCGQLIGDCTCGMAAERRGFVTGLAAAGQNKLEAYLAYADQYGLDAFASQDIRKVVRGYKLANAPEERPQIVVEPQKVDIGNVSPREGKVETSTTIKNTGQRDLIVDSLSTSCACTMVSVVTNGQEGPVFGTDTPPEGWSIAIRPGETAELRIYYDPNFHKDARGPMIREIYVSSNDPIDPVIKASIEFNQVD